MDSCVGGMLRVIEQVSLLLLTLETRIKRVSWMLVSVCSSQDSLPSDLRTGSEYCIRNVDFIHEPTLPSGNHNIRCPFMIIGWWNCNFKSALVKNFHDLTGPILVPPGIASKILYCGVLEKACILGTTESTAQNRRPRQVEFCIFSQLIPYVWTCFLVSCFQMLVLEEIPQVLLLVISHMLKTSLVTDSFSFACPFSFSVKPNCSHQFVTAP